MVYFIIVFSSNYASCDRNETISDADLRVLSYTSESLVIIDLMDTIFFLLSSLLAGAKLN